jgi:hypothetical protein
VNNTIESYDPQSGHIRVAYTSTEEVVSVYSYDLPSAHGMPPSEQELDQLIRARAPVWRLTASVGAEAHPPTLATLELGTHVHTMGAVPTLDDCKAAKIAQIRKFRDAVLYADVTHHDGSCHVNLAYAGWLTAITTLGLTRSTAQSPIQWPGQDHRLTDIRLEDALNLLQTMVQHATRVFQTAAQKEYAITVAQTEQAVADVTWIEPGVKGGVLTGNLFVTSGPSHQTYETEITVDRVVVQ